MDPVKFVPSTRLENTGYVGTRLVYLVNNVEIGSINCRSIESARKQGERFMRRSQLGLMDMILAAYKDMGQQIEELRTKRLAIAKMIGTSV